MFVNAEEFLKFSGIEVKPAISLGFTFEGVFDEDRLVPNRQNSMAAFRSWLAKENSDDQRRHN